ncbi:MAG: lipoprotein [Mycoplasmatota bacterium]
MKKIILIFIITLLLTGCTVDYELEIKNGQFNENITFYFDEDEENDKNYLIGTDRYALYELWNGKLYNLETSENSVTYDYSFTYEEYQNSLAIAYCYDEYDFSEDSDNYYISTSNQFNCLVQDYITADSIRVIITTNHDVISNNASIIEDNKYIWEFNNDNYTNNPIEIVISKSYNNDMETFVLLSVVVILLVGITGTILFVKRKNSERNKI